MTTVYLLDDEPVLVSLLSEVVDRAGLQARGFTSASHFFEQVTQFSLGEILALDLKMPETDGIEVMRRLATMLNPPSLVLMSGLDTGVLHAAEKLGKAHKLDILASLTKPVSIDRFQQILLEHIPDAKDLSDIQLPHKKSAKEELSIPELQAAISQNQLVLHYQPQIEMATGILTGVEALIRLQHPEQGLVFPDRFIPLAEQNNLLSEVTHWVIGEVVHQERQWESEGLPISVSANISAGNITSLTLPEQLAELLSDNSLDPTRLTLEVTESALMGELVTSLDTLTRLRLKGIGLSIDDFGTGYSSLSQLHRVPFTELKVDRSFVCGMVDDAEARAIVKTCIMLGHELNMRIVAEGVENQQTWDLLSKLGCDVAQGYFIAKPMPEDELIKWIKKREHSAPSVKASNASIE
ncbi:EAL domain-containing protein [Pseudomonadota bacterium]